MSHRTHPRHRIHGAVALILAIGFASGCGASRGGSAATGAVGSSVGASATSAAAAGLLAPAEGHTQYPLDVKTAWGTSTIEKRPERVATVSPDANDTELMLALHSYPVTTSSDGFDQAPWLKAAAGGRIEQEIESGGDGPYSYEKIAAAKPDVIVVYDYDISKEYDKLAAIAPVVASESKPGKGSPEDWKANIRSLSNVLDLKDAGERVIKDYDTRVHKIRTEHPELTGKTITYCVYYGGQYGLTFTGTPESRSAGVFEAIGMRTPAGVASLPADGKVSEELLAKLDADVIYIHNVSDLMGSNTFDQLIGNALFKKIPAVHKGHLITTSSDKSTGWALTTAGPMGTFVALDQLVAQLAQKLK